MKLNDFSYELPEELIAHFPSPQRSGSRLLVYDPAQDRVEHRVFRDLPDLLRAQDCLVLNDSRVMPVRYLGKRKTGAQIEVLFVRQDGDRFHAFVRGKGRVKVGETLELEGGMISCRLLERIGHWGEWWVDCPGLEDLRQVFQKGRAPLPPYIAWARKDETEPDFDRERYQTVFATDPGSIAAPTAGLHFTEELLGQIRGKGVRVVPITLHVGPGTFLPVREQEIEKHQLRPERFSVSPEAAQEINQAREKGGRVIAVGTTVTRVLETVSDSIGRIQPQSGESALFIHHPYQFKAIDALVTNFHLPESTLLMLVCAFVGREKCLDLYREAVAKKYRFFSYGDAMFLA